MHTPTYEDIPDRTTQITSLAKCVAAEYRILDHVEPECRQYVLEALGRFIDGIGLLDSKEFCDKFAAVRKN